MQLSESREPKRIRTDDNMQHAELARPEIRIIRVNMNYTLKSSLDVVKVFPSAKDVPDAQMVPTLVYSECPYRTMNVMEAMDRARETVGGAYIPASSCVRRFHHITGDLDKRDVIRDWGKEEFPVISCTRALELGEGWKRVRMVVNMGRGDAANVSEILAKCGKEGRPGLAVILFVERLRRKGKNSVDQFTPGVEQTAEDRMDALAITPVCLRIAFSVHDSQGYIPVSTEDPSYIEEREREIEQGFDQCKCSNCAPDKVAAFVKNLVFATKDNFDDIMKDQFIPPRVLDLKHKYPARKAPPKKKKFPRDERALLDKLKEQLIPDMHRLYNAYYSSGPNIPANVIFGDTQAESLVTNLDKTSTKDEIEELIGVEWFPGQLDWLFNTIHKFQFKHGLPIPKPKIPESPEFVEF